LNQRQRAEHLNIRCINVVLGCIRNNQLGRAIKFLKQVKEEGIADEGVLFEKIFLHISNGGEDENEMCWLDVEDGFTVVAAMRELGLRPSRISLEALLDGCAAMSDPEQAQRVVQEMEQEGLCLNIFSMIRLFRAYIAGEDEERALNLLNEMPASDLQDPDVRVLILQTLQPHYVAAADSPEAARAPETLPRVRARLDELLGTDLIPGTRIRL
jgi:pentatricopeptide repeat protein